MDADKHVVKVARAATRFLLVSFKSVLYYHDTKCTLARTNKACCGKRLEL
jgi:hypothetical protein